MSVTTYQVLSLPGTRYLVPGTHRYEYGHYSVARGKGSTYTRRPNIALSSTLSLAKPARIVTAQSTGTWYFVHVLLYYKY